MLSLRDKIGQLLILGFDGLSIEKDSFIVEQIERSALGGIILFDRPLHAPSTLKNIESPSQVKRLNHELQRVNQEANKKFHRPALPLLCSVDCEGGQVNRLKERFGFPALPAVSEVAKKGDAYAQEVAQMMASTLQLAGFNVNFAPILDVNINPQNPILGALDRCFSEDAETVAHFAAIYAHALKAKGIEPVYKHFPGHGSSTADSHLGCVDVSDTWQSIELTPYRRLIQEGGVCQMIMTAHLVNRALDASNLPATLSHKTLTGLLRQELGFTGVIVTDDMQMKAIADHFGLEESLCLALNAGADMFIFANQWADAYQSADELIDLIENNVRAGRIDERRIDESYARVHALKSSIQ